MTWYILASINSGCCLREGSEENLSPHASSGGALPPSTDWSPPHLPLDWGQEQEERVS